ncbi:MAG: threonine/serine dehydratase [Acidobacteriota bacterium]
MVTIDDVRKAAERLAPVAIKTPVLPSEILSARSGRQVLLKAENLQRTGSFKIRGAYNKIASLDPEERKRGVVTYSSGNHAQGVACAAKILETRAVVVMPENAIQSKVSATKDYGAEIVLSGRTTLDREATARELEKDQGLVMVPPFDDPMVIAGQGTAGLEILEQVPDVEAVLVPVGGGGLLSGVATAIKSLRPEVKVIGVEPQKANKMYLSLSNQSLTEIGYPETVADGLRPVKPGRLPFEIASKLVDEILLVPDGDILEAMFLLLDKGKLVVEPSGATAAAALFTMHGHPAGRKVVAVLSGGNLDFKMLPRYLESAGTR